jgi:hypothetical protein
MQLETFVRMTARPELKGDAVNGANPALKPFASELVPTVTQHLEAARKL